MGDEARPRVLHLRVVAGTGGGPEKTILHSPRFIRAEGIDAMVAYLCPPQDPIGQSLLDRAQAADCPFYLLHDHGPLDFGLIIRLVRLCRQLEIDIIQSHDYKSNALAWCVRRFYRCCLITMLHGWTDMSGRMPLYKRIDQWFLPCFESLICVSQDLVEECLRLRIPAQRLHLVHNAIDTEHYRRRREPVLAKKAMKASPDRFLIGSVGRLSPEKGFADLIGAVVSLQNQVLAVDLWIAREGPERGRLNEIIESSPAQGSIRLLGQMEDPRLFFEAMDLFVLNSVREGLPNVLLEAMAMETPAMATDTGGISALLRDGETGYLIPPESHSVLGQALRAAIASPGARTAMASAGRELIERDFGFDARIKKIASIYYRQLQQSGHFHRRSSGRLPLVPQG